MNVRRISYRGFFIELLQLGKDRWASSVYDKEAHYDHGTICNGGSDAAAIQEAKIYIDDIIDGGKYC